MVTRSAAHLYLCLLFLFGIPLLLFSVLLVVKLQWLHSLYFVVVFIPLWIMDCGDAGCTSDVVMLTILVLGPTIVEFVQQSIMRNIRGIMDVENGGGLTRRHWIFSASIPLSSFPKSFTS